MELEYFPISDGNRDCAITILQGNKQRQSFYYATNTLIGIMGNRRIKSSLPSRAYSIGTWPNHRLFSHSQEASGGEGF
jgi:hypothetical protein